MVTGPTGSGKTTTLYASLDILNNPEVNITTYEDPVEVKVPGLNQSQVRADIGFSFAV
ncbi:MAG: Flp pilus assembly complex ATPase component TadA [Candidatus Peribacteria bacterium]|nr:MAG: Flp pilus assembly complex ATPase component TadA [Candidatus Peribacteria bacterium]